MKILMGHSRHATIGTITPENNHPFKKDEGSTIIGMHNGTIRGRFTHRDKYEVDSEALFHLISEKGLKNALEEVNEECYNTAYALSVFGFKDNSISLIKNDERPLYIGKADGDLYWASEKNFLEMAFSRAGIEDYSIDPVKSHSLVKIFPLKKEAKERLKVIPNYVKKTEYKTSYGWSYGYGRGYQGQGQGQSSNLPTKVDKKKDKGKGDKEYVYLPFYSDPYGVFYNVGRRIFNATEFEKDTIQIGCSICGDKEYYLPDLRFSKVTHEEYYCRNCKDTLEDVFNVKWDDLDEAYLTLRSPETDFEDVKITCGDWDTPWENEDDDKELIESNYDTQQ
jgi:asparagine synthetase B (glutamine-hydrolysing)